MAILKNLNGDKYKDDNALQDVVNYALSPLKCIHGYFGGCGVDFTDPAQSMNLIAEQYGKNSGVRLRHLVLSFSQYELNDPKIANDIGWLVSNRLGTIYQTIYAVHEDKEYLHIHLIFNSISFVNGNRFYGTRKEFYWLMEVIRDILKQFSIHKFYYLKNK